MRLSDPNKVTAAHLKRNAYLYVRQSTLQQVFGNPESTRRQYDLKGRAVALGWPEEQIVVIDSDLGQSGASCNEPRFSPVSFSRYFQSALSDTFPVWVTR